MRKSVSILSAFSVKIRPKSIQLTEITKNVAEVRYTCIKLESTHAIHLSIPPPSRHPHEGEAVLSGTWKKGFVGGLEQTFTSQEWATPNEYDFLRCMQNPGSLHERWIALLIDHHSLVSSGDTQIKGYEWVCTLLESRCHHLNRA